MSKTKDKILILLATRNGEKYLQDQLDSFRSQKDINWDLLVSDDGSDDTTLQILESFKAQVHPTHEVTILHGPCRGSAQNFLHLITQTPPTPHLVAFADQDDVWMPEKLAVAQQAIQNAGQNTRPVLYAAGSVTCDENLIPGRPSPVFSKPPGFANALVQSIGGGNTMVLNASAIGLLQAAAKEIDDIAVHDWWAYQLISGSGGEVIRDPQPVLYYRQHGANAIGANTSLRGKLGRALFIVRGGLVQWNTTNMQALQASAHRFTPQARRILSLFIKARHGNVIQRLTALYQSGVYRQHRRGTVMLYLACLLGRL